MFQYGLEQLIEQLEETPTVSQERHLEASKTESESEPVTAAPQRFEASGRASRSHASLSEEQW